MVLKLGTPTSTTNDDDEGTLLTYDIRFLRVKQDFLWLPLQPLGIFLQDKLTIATLFAYMAAPWKYMELQLDRLIATSAFILMWIQ